MNTEQKQVYTNVYCAVCNEPVKMADVVREAGNSYHQACLDNAKGACLWTGDHEPDLA